MLMNETFWSMVIYDVLYASGMLTPCWSGWIGALFPYRESGFQITKNEIVSDEMPSGLMHVPFSLSIRDEIFKLSISAGFFWCLVGTLLIN
ncbi:unnamed protein product [Rhizophagus irregularis]|nr:unnamed protein product [Rhizophagus irregularis]